MIQFILTPYKTSSLCSGCGGRIAPMEKVCQICGLDRDVNACLNLLRMWRGSGSAESLSVSVVMLGCQGIYAKADAVNPAELRGSQNFPIAWLIYR
ncbi:transposase [Candidatus Bathyarchaeota archaeon]|nr:transposase [Candidatus Bathyarchaeota archaeon]